MTTHTWAVARRLDTIDLCLLMRGEVGRHDLIEIFGVSAGQASADLNEFITLYPQAMSYDKTAKRYVPANGRYVPVRDMVRDKRTREALAVLTRR